MKITRIQSFHVKPRFLFVRIDTDEGITGWGEATLEGRTRVVATMIDHIAEYLVGEDPTRIQHHWQVIYRGDFYRGGPVGCSALSGVEQALWDITGKFYGQPVYNLLGGKVRNHIPMYTGIGESMDYLNIAKKREHRGLTAVKFGAFGPARIVESAGYIDKLVSHFARLRETLGPDIGIALDGHGRLSPAVAKILVKELEPYRPMFIEEPVLPENVDQMAEIAHHTCTPIATGERLFTKWAFREVLEKKAAVILQPDLSHAGGILESRFIAAMAEANFAAIAPHCPMGPIALAACIQLDACIPNFMIQEFATLGENYLKKPFELDAGHVHVPTAPGLGIEIDEDALQEQLYDGTWRTPAWRHDDGSVADW